MPLPESTTRQDIIKNIPTRIAAYNSSTSYNSLYLRYITERETGINSSGSLEKWLVTPETADLIHAFMNDFGMRSYQLTLPVVYTRKLFELSVGVDIEGLSRFTLDQGPLATQIGNSTVAQELGKLFDFCSKWRHFSESGGIVIGSKVAHAILPQLCPMIDINHTAISLYNVAPGEYLTLSSWDEYLGYTPRGKINPSPRGGGCKRWRKDQFLCAIGFYAQIYHDWQKANGHPGMAAFLSQDPTQGTTGIPRLLDKVFW